jgi:hypothetical protein
MQKQSVNSSSLRAVTFLQVTTFPDASIFKIPIQSYRQDTIKLGQSCI